MTFKVLLLGLVMLDSLICSSSRAAINDTNNNQSFAPHNTVRYVLDDGTFSAGNTKCWPTNECGKHDENPHSWCYTDESEKEKELCCTGECTVSTPIVDGKEWRFYACPSGDECADCGSPGLRNVTGTSCLTSYPCGTHGYKYYWCYVNDNKAWEYCCHLLSNCASNGYDKNHWCYVDFYYVPRWKNRVPLKPEYRSTA